MRLINKIIEKMQCMCAVPTTSARRISRRERNQNRSKTEKETKHNFFSKLFKNSENSTPNFIEYANGTRISKKYKLSKELGRGSFGITLLCKERRTGIEFACKCISKKNLMTQDSIDDVRREVQVMRHLPPHPNIVSLQDVYEDETNIYLIIDLCEGGELYSRIKARGHYEEKDAAILFKSMVEVIQFCHEKGVVHRDLKPENFLFSDKTDGAILKLIDFGFSTFIRPGQKLTDTVGSLNFIAPEVLTGSYGPKADIWSLGVILYILLSGEYPFRGDDDRALASEILKGNIKFNKEPWGNVSKAGKDLVKKILNHNQKKRLSADEISGHAWFGITKKMPSTRFGKIHRSLKISNLKRTVGARRKKNEI